MVWCDAADESRRCSGRDTVGKAWLLMWGAAAALTRQQMPFTCPFPNASLRTVEYEGGSGQSERAARIRAPLSWRWEAGEGRRELPFRDG